jgi:calcineurin-like phosphoesterase
MGDARLSSVVIDVDEATGHARSIERLVVRGDDDPSDK